MGYFFLYCEAFELHIYCRYLVYVDGVGPFVLRLKTVVFAILVLEDLLVLVGLFGVELEFSVGLLG